MSGADKVALMANVKSLDLTPILRFRLRSLFRRLDHSRCHVRANYP
jgi:hypothetical protein